jgi:hypothetical protein
MSSPAFPFSIGTSAVAWMLGIVGLLIWTLFHLRDDFGPKIILVVMVFVAVGPVCDAVMNSENTAFPLRFDHFLYLVDQNLGVSAFSVARLLSAWQRSVLFQFYQSLTLAMVVWYGVNLKAKDGRSNRVLIAYAVTLVVGPCLYLLLPASGPRHAFGATFPMGSPSVSLDLIRLDNWPNAMPSLHVSIALLFVLFAGKSRALRWIASTYLAGTILATLAFEHYVVDLIVAVPFAFFVTRAAEGEIRRAACYLAVVLAWMLSIRYSAAPLISAPVGLRILAAVTIAFPAFSMIGRKMRPHAGSQGCPVRDYAVAPVGQDGA